MSSLILSRTTLPLEGVKGVFTTRKIRKGDLAILSNGQSALGHDLLAGCGRGGHDGRGSHTLSRWEPIFDVDCTAPFTSSPSTPERHFEEQEKRLARLVQSVPMQRPLVLFSRERFLALRHTWTSDRHYTMFLPHLPSIDLVVPPEALLVKSNTAQEAEQVVDANKTSNTFGTAALDIQKLSKTSPPVMASNSNSNLFFEVNDPFPCQLPDPEDVANTAYWKHTKKWLADYSQTAANGQQLVKGHSFFSPNVQLVKIPREHLEDQEDEMLPSLGRSQGNEEDRYGLVATRDIPANTELFLSYGADWWRQRLLSTLLLSAESPSEMGSVRWIERLCAPEGQEDETFPYIATEQAIVRGGKRHAARRTILWDALRQERATNQAVIAYTVRQSCLDGEFASQVMQLFTGDDGLTVLPALRRTVRSYLQGKEKQSSF